MELPHAAPEEEGADAPPQQVRNQVRFRPPGPKIVDSEFMDVAEAVDAVGVGRFPDVWGWDPIWRKMPFRSIPSRNVFQSYKLSMSTGTPELISQVVDIRRTSFDPAQCHCLYKQVRDDLIKGLFKGEITAHSQSKRGRITRIEQDRRGIWTSQWKEIFYTGYYVDGAPLERFWVLIDRAKLLTWIDPRILATSDDLNSHLMKTLYSELAVATAERATKMGYTPIKKDTLGLIASIFMELGIKDTSRNKLSKLCWGDASLEKYHGSGNRGSKSKARRESDREGLRACLAQVVRAKGKQKTVTT